MEALIVLGSMLTWLVASVSIGRIQYWRWMAKDPPKNDLDGDLYNPVAEGWIAALFWPFIVALSPLIGLGYLIHWFVQKPTRTGAVALKRRYYEELERELLP